MISKLLFNIAKRNGEFSENINKDLCFNAYLTPSK